MTFCRRRAWRTVRRRTVGRWISVVRNRWDTTGSWDVTGSSAGESSCTYLNVLYALYRETSNLRSLHWTVASVNICLSVCLSVTCLLVRDWWILLRTSWFSVYLLEWTSWNFRRKKWLLKWMMVHVWSREVYFYPGKSNIGPFVPVGKFR